MAESKIFTSQAGIKQKALGPNATKYDTDNLFAGVWRLDQANLDKFDPFITGYAFWIWTKMPAFFDETMKSQFRNLTEKNFKAYSGIGDMTLQVEDMTMGFAGNAYGVATNIQKENTQFSITHYELAGSPIRELYQYWITGIRDPETGLSHYHGKLGSKECPTYSAKYHTGEGIYIVTDPSGAIGGETGIEFAAYYTNILPTKVPQDHLNYNAGDHGTSEIQMDFRGNFHQSKAINALAAEVMKSYRITKQYGDYGVSNASYNPRGYNEG